MSRHIAFLTLALFLINGAGALAGDPAAPPPTAKIPVEEDFHGTVLTDDYSWLEDAEAPEVVAWSEPTAAPTIYPP